MRRLLRDCLLLCAVIPTRPTPVSTSQPVTPKQDAEGKIDVADALRQLAEQSAQAATRLREINQRSR